MRKLVWVAALTAILCIGFQRRVPAPPFPPAITEEATVDERTYFYDLDHRAGVVEAPEDEGYIEVYTDPTAPEPFASAEGLSIAIPDWDLPEHIEPFDPYYVRRYHPAFGCISSVNLHGARWLVDDWNPYNAEPASMMVPVRSSNPASGIPDGLKEIDADYVFSNIADLLTSQTTTLSVHNTFASDSLSTSSLAIEIGVITNSRDLSITVDYLSSQRPTDTITQGGHVSWGLLWGDCCHEIEVEEESVFHHVDDSSPLEETIMVSASVEGYTTDTIVIDAEAGKNYVWTPVFAPLPGSDAPYPGGVFPDAGILAKGVADELLGECSPGAALSSARDPNEDGVQDAADLKAAPQEGE